MAKKKIISLVLIIVFVGLLYVFSKSTKKTYSANFTSSTATLSNAKFSESGSLTFAFTTINEIPVSGDIYITIPSVNTTGKTNDGIPDTAATTAAGGFDIGEMTIADISITGCTDSNWTVVSITPGDAAEDHRILINRTSFACTAGTAITVTIDSSPGIINPAPITTHTEGKADSYRINIKSRDIANATLDNIDVSVAPIEGVLISATVEEILSLTVLGITADSGSYCGVTRTISSPDTTATSVPWGTLPVTYAAATNNTDHQVSVSTNATSGYFLYAEENDQMGKDGVACTGASASESVDCIQDTLCGTTPCTHQTFRDWGSDPSSYPGLGYSLENVSGTDAQFEFDDLTAVFNAKQFSDQEASESRDASTAHLMTNSEPVDSSSVYVCYRIDVTATQPAGYYINKVKYTAVATF